MRLREVLNAGSTGCVILSRPSGWQCTSVRRTAWVARRRCRPVADSSGHSRPRDRSPEWLKCIRDRSSSPRRATEVRRAPALNASEASSAEDGIVYLFAALVGLGGPPILVRLMPRGFHSQRRSGRSAAFRDGPVFFADSVTACGRSLVFIGLESWQSGTRTGGPRASQEVEGDAFMSARMTTKRASRCAGARETLRAVPVEGASSSFVPRREHRERFAAGPMLDRADGP